MRADLVLEGGGVKGIGLVGAVRALEAQGYDLSDTDLAECRS